VHTSSVSSRIEAPHTPLSFDACLQETPVNISINLILPETKVSGLVFATSGVRISYAVVFKSYKVGALDIPAQKQRVT